MRIASWNVCFENLEILSGITALIQAGHEVILLQEVPGELLDRVKALMPFSASCRECHWKETGYQTHLVTLSKFPIQGLDIRKHRQWETLVGRHLSIKEATEFLVADIYAYGESWRFINIHLPLYAPPRVRLQELNRVANHIHAKRRNIICGDLNSHANILSNLIFMNLIRISYGDIFWSERRMLEKFLKKKSLCNPFEGTKTHNLYPGQLDYIIHCKRQQCAKAFRGQQRFGSDHWPLLVEMAL